MSYTLQVKDGYDKRKSAPMFTVRPLTMADLDWVDSQSHVSFVGRDGTMRRVKVNGKIRRWKKDPNRIEIPIKYGMYEYATFYLRQDGRLGNDVAFWVRECGTSEEEC